MNVGVYMMRLCAVSLLVDFVVRMLVEVIVVALPLLRTANVLGDPDDRGGFCDGDDDLDLIFHHHWAGRWRW